MSQQKLTWLPILILLALAASACTGTLSEKAQAGAGETSNPLDISDLEISASPLAVKEDSQPVSQAEAPLIEPAAEPPEGVVKPAAEPETTAEIQTVSETAAIGGFLAAELVPIATFPAANATSTLTAVTAVDFSPDGALVAAAFSNGVVQLWSSGDETLIFTLDGHTAQVTDLALSPDGNLLASAGEDSQVLVWDTAEGTRVNTISTSLIGRALAVSFSPDGNQIAVGGHKCAVAQYSTWTGLLNRTFPQPGCDLRDSGSVQSWGLAYSADGNLLITAEGQNGEGGSIQTWLLESYFGSEQVEYFYLGIQDLALSPDGSTLAAALIGSSQITLIDAQSGAALHVLEGHLHRVNGVTFSPDGRLLVSASRDGSVRLWDVSTGLLLRTLESHNAAVNTVAFSPDGALIASGSDDGTVIVWALDITGD